MGYVISMTMIMTQSKTLPKLTIKGVPLNAYLATGNKKLPRTTAIFNMGSAHDCPSLKLGLCQAFVGEKLVCYAMKAEAGMWPGVLPYRRRQESFWKRTSASGFAYQFLLINSMKRTPYTALRINESGDFWSQECVDKANDIAECLDPEGVMVYCYTARQDLDFAKVTKLVINGSGFKKEGILNEFKMVERVEDKPQGYGVCYGDCRVCHRCLLPNKNTVVIKH